VPTCRGQYLTATFPVLSAVRRMVRLDDWEFTITTETGQVHRWDWAGLHALPTRRRHGRPALRDALVEFGRRGGVSLDDLFENVETGGRVRGRALLRRYTTNLPLEDLLDASHGSVHQRRRDLTPEHGARPACSCAHLYLWKSASGVRGITLGYRTTGFWGASAPQLRRPMASSGTGATDLAGRDVAEVRDEPRTARTLVLDVPGCRATTRASTSTSAHRPDGYTAVRSYSIGVRGRGDGSRSPSSRC